MFSVRFKQFVCLFVCLGKRAIFVFFACFARVRLFPFPCYWYCWCDRMRGEFVSIKMRSLSLGALCYKTSKPISESTQELETEWGTNACQAGFDSREPSAHPHAQAYNRQQSFVPNNANGAISLRTTSKGECQPSLSAHFFFNFDLCSHLLRYILSKRRRTRNAIASNANYSDLCCSAASRARA